MARAKKHDRSVICFDMNMESDNKDRAMKALDYLLYMKQLVPSNKNDLMRMIIFNTEHEDGRRNMFIPFTEFISYKDYVNEAMRGHKPTASKWISAIRTAITWLCEASEEKELYTLQLIIFTDLTTPFDAEDSETTVKLVTLLSSYSIYLYVLGPEVIEPHYITSVADIQKWSRGILYKNDKGCSFTRDCFSKMIRECDGIMCEPFLGIELIELYRSTRGKQPWQAPLELGNTGIELKVKTSRSINLFSTPRLKSGFRPGCKFMAQGKQIQPDEVVNAFRIDEKIIVVPRDVKVNYVKAYNGPRMLKLVAFVSRSSIPEAYMHGGEAHAIEIPAETEHAHALQTLIRSCHKLNRCALAWRVYNRNNCPRLYALLPRVDPTCNFYMVPLANAMEIQLPYTGGDAEQLKNLPKGNTNSDYYQSVIKYLEMLRVDENKPALHPTLTSGPWLKCFLQRLNHLKKRKDGEISADEPLPHLDIGRTKLGDDAVEVKEFLKNHLQQKVKEETPDMQVDVDVGNDDEW